MDAIRFDIAESTAAYIRLRVIEEKGCWPGRIEILEFLEARQEFAIPHRDPVVQRQATAFLETYLRLRNLASV